jgi:hypothetical protein
MHYIIKYCLISPTYIYIYTYYIIYIHIYTLNSKKWTQFVSLFKRVYNGILCTVFS